MPCAATRNGGMKESWYAELRGCLAVVAPPGNTLLWSGFPPRREVGSGPIRSIGWSCRALQLSWHLESYTLYRRLFLFVVSQWQLQKAVAWANWVCGHGGSFDSCLSIFISYPWLSCAWALPAPLTVPLLGSMLGGERGE